MRDLPSNFFKDAAHVLLENGAAYVFLLNPCRLWTGSRMKPSSTRTALSLLTFGRCSPLTLNEWHAWFSSRYRGDLMEIGMWTPQKLQAWGCLRVDWLSSTHDAIRGDPIPGYEDLEASKE
ncbi:hypothetical protein AAG906_013212 [Vitis piasezkii]